MATAARRSARHESGREAARTSPHAAVNAVVRARRLTKFYGDEGGVLDLDFEVGAGEVFGFLGPNGAGKTTAIRLMLDLIRPSRGHIELFGSDPRKVVDVRRRVGYLPGDLRLYDRLTARELFSYFAHLRGLRDLGSASALAERLGLELDRPIRALEREPAEGRSRPGVHA
jgi:ABC-2 type transport system ATP-binding protein